jgi:hypothetical protein
MLGVVFARFSAPFKRAQSIRFSSVATVSRHPSGYWAMTFRCVGWWRGEGRRTCLGARFYSGRRAAEQSSNARAPGVCPGTRATPTWHPSPQSRIPTARSVANVRKHQLLKPEMSMIVTAIDSITPSNYVFEHLAIEDIDSQQTNLQLGFPATVVHVVRPESPLYNLRLGGARGCVRPWAGRARGLAAGRLLVSPLHNVLIAALAARTRPPRLGAQAHRFVAR